MTYIIDDIQFDLSNPINKYWYSKFKKSILKNQINYIKNIICDAKNKNKILYSPQYYACAKFIKYTTKFKFIKIQILSYQICTYNEDFLDIFIVKDINELRCSKYSNLNIDCNANLNGKKIGKCSNNCCNYFRIYKKFYILWI